MDEHQRIFKLASILLQHPDEEWFESGELTEEIAKVNDKLTSLLFKQFLQEVKAITFIELCEKYVRTFDFNEKTTLYLTYPLFAETPDRGKGLVKLKEEYLKAGFPLESDELPDYLPLLLEFCSFAPLNAVKKMILIHRKSMDLLVKELALVNSPYQLIVQACIQTAENLLSKQKAS
ncbi:nitrate reductase molybdenum cofactor assembly chaperone [Neobacillus sp. SM06]|uniref:nitrate reductase molybdenum cofactor assembly chaperone n=1 Tax=Neobacillus sp. SM06 TaxID=3422492 RepID=UPI003D29C5E1